MKALRFFTKSVFLVSAIAIFAGCSDYVQDPDPSTGGPLFLIACNGNDDGSLVEGLYTMQIASPAPKLEFITEYYPWAKGLNYVDFNNGRIAFNVDNPPEGQSRVAYMDVSNLKDVKFVPNPSAPEGWVCKMSKGAKPLVFKDGRIAYHVVFTREVYEDHHEGQLAIYNPKNGSIELSGKLTDFILAQPENGGDTEDGSMKAGFALSPDNKYIYCWVYGYGTTWGSYHEDTDYIARYTVGKPFSYERVEQTSRVDYITGDGKYLIVGGGIHRITLSTSSFDQDISEYDIIAYSGQVSKKSSKVLRAWGGQGLAIYDFNGAESIWLYYITRNEDMEKKYNAAGGEYQFSADESHVYFTGSTDFWNHKGDMVVYSSLIEENNTKPDSLTFLPSAFNTGGFFLLISE